MSIPFLFCITLAGLMCGAAIGIIALGLCVAAKKSSDYDAEFEDVEDWHLDTHA